MGSEGGWSGPYQKLFGEIEMTKLFAHRIHGKRRVITPLVGVISLGVIYITSPHNALL